MAFCNKCGNFMEEGQQFCTKCGFNKNSGVVYADRARAPRFKTGLAVNLKPVLIISVIQLLCIFFLPMCNMVPYGAFFNDANIHFIDVIDIVFDYGLFDVLDNALARLPVVGFAFCLLVIIGAAIRKKAVCLVGSILGFAISLFSLFDLVDSVDAKYVFSFDETCVCFGFWLVLILFVVSFVKALKTK